MVSVFNMLKHTYTYNFIIKLIKYKIFMLPLIIYINIFWIINSITLLNIIYVS